MAPEPAKEQDETKEQVVEAADSDSASDSVIKTKGPHSAQQELEDTGIPVSGGQLPTDEELEKLRLVPHLLVPIGASLLLTADWQSESATVAARTRLPTPFNSYEPFTTSVDERSTTCVAVGGLGHSRRDKKRFAGSPLSSDSIFVGSQDDPGRRFPAC